MVEPPLDRPLGVRCVEAHVEPRPRERRTSRPALDPEDAPGETPDDGVAGFQPLDVDPVLDLVPLRAVERGAAPEEARFQGVRPAVLRAEDIAVAAFVAEVRERGELMLLRDLERRILFATEPAVGERVKLHDGDRGRREGVGEIGVVGADGHTLVAGEAIEERELRADLRGALRVRGVLVASVAERSRRVRAGVRDADGGEPVAEHPVGRNLPHRSSAGESAPAGGRGISVDAPESNGVGESGLAVPVRAKLEVGDRGRADQRHAVAKIAEVVPCPGVAPGAKKIGTDRDRHEPERDRVREVRAVDAGREGDRAAVADGVTKATNERHREDVERLAGKVHDLLGRREEGAVVLDDERVGELDAQPLAERVGGVLESPGDVERLLPRCVLREGLVGDALDVAEHVVEDAPGLDGSEQGRVELHHAVEAVITQEVEDDSLDLVGRAPVERRERERVRERSREGEVAVARVLGGNLLAEPLDDRARVLHPQDERPHPRTTDPLKVVADAHVEDRASALWPEADKAARHEDLDEHARLHVLLERLLERELLRPLDVVADRRRVDARSRDREGVHDLDGLQLEDPRPREEGQDDVLRELRVRARGRTERRGGSVPVERDREVVRPTAAKEVPRLEIEDPAVPRQLLEHPGDEAAKRDRVERRHGPSIVRLGSAVPDDFSGRTMYRGGGGKMAKLGMEREIVDHAVYERTVARFREASIVLPTFAELADPTTIAPPVRAALAAVDPDAAHPLNLFRVHWWNDDTRREVAAVPRYLSLPSSLTGVPAKILVALGDRFPMIHAHKVLAAYGCLVPRIVTGQFDPTTHRAVWPSTGNYCRGGVAISRILGCHGVAVLPAGMSRERFEWLEKWCLEPGDIVRTPGTESNVKEIYDECARIDQHPENIIFNQFCEFGNYLVHFYVTGRALEAVFLAEQRKSPSLHLAAYTSATGSAGTLAAGDWLKERLGARIVAVEATECPTLLYNGYGEHNIQGIGDKHVPYIHNVMNTDVVAGVSDHATDTLDVLFNSDVGRAYLRDRRGVPADVIAGLGDMGFSGIANVLAAIKTAKRLRLGADDAIVTVATDGAAMYASERGSRVTKHFARGFDAVAAGETFGRHLLGQATDDLLELTQRDRERMFNLGYFTWVEQQGVPVGDFDARRQPSFWRGLRPLFASWDRMIGEFNARVRGR